MKICPVGAELFHADGRTKLIVGFRSFDKASKNGFHFVTFPQGYPLGWAVV
jgi:hypothetical protein